MYKIGMIGTGIIGKSHAEALKSVGNACLSVVCDIVSERAKNFGEIFNVPFYTDYKEMIRNEKLDIILINLPHGLHLEAAIFSIENGLNVFIEKPMANTVEECAKIISCAKKYNVKVAVGHLQRYISQNIIAKELIQSKKYGDIINIVDIRNANYFNENRPKWFFDKKLSGGGMVMNFGAHSLDKIKFLTDRKITSIYGSTYQRLPNIEVEGNAQILVKLDNDISAIINYCGYTTQEINETTIFLEKATIKLSTGWKISIALPDEDFIDIETGVQINTFASMWEDFLNAISNNKEPVLSVEYAMDIIKNIENVYSQNTADYNYSIDTEFLDTICKKINMPNEVTQKLQNLALHFNISHIYPYINLLNDLQTAPVAIDTINKILENNPNKEFLWLLILLFSAKKAKHIYDEKGISEKIFYDTMGCYSRQVREYKESFGVYGYDRQSFSYRAVALNLFRLGELEFERITLEDQNKVLSVHIPSDAKITIENCMTSYSEAIIFYKIHYPDYTFDNFYCSSWLLSPNLKYVLKEDSNILKFASFYDIFNVVESSKDFERWVYKNNYENIEDYPKNTSLQINIYNYLKNGGKIGSASGFSSINKTIFKK